MVYINVSQCNIVDTAYLEKFYSNINTDGLWSYQGKPNLPVGLGVDLGDGNHGFVFIRVLDFGMVLGVPRLPTHDPENTSHVIGLSVT